MISQARQDEEAQETPEPEPAPSLQWWLEPIPEWREGRLTIHNPVTDVTTDIDLKTGAVKRTKGLE
jgi:hypothetical protein